MAEVAKKLITVDEYMRMGEAGILSPNDHVELIDGEIFEMSPVGSKHASVVKKLAKLLNDQWSDKVIISIQDPIVLDKQNQPEPDLAVLNFKEDFYENGHPSAADVLLAIEVADTTIKYDKEIKLPLYARHLIPEVWVINLQENCIEVYESPLDAKYQIETVKMPGEMISIPGNTIDVSRILPAS